MRRKSRLDERVETAARGKHLLVVEGREFYDKPENERSRIFDLKQVFGNDNPVRLEIGCGKGGFAFEIARRYPEINFIAVEKISNVIIEACEKADEIKPENLRFMNCCAENLPYYLSERSIEKIYLNFSCPYPKFTYRNRRLTYYRYLEIYKKLLVKGGEIEIKTDNRKFFEFSLQSFSENGYLLKDISLDLHSDDLKDNIETEYEKMFVSQGKIIYKATAYLK